MMYTKSMASTFSKIKDAGFKEGFTPKPFDEYTEEEREKILTKAAKEAALALNNIRYVSPFYYHLIMQIDIKFTVAIPRAATNYKSILLHPVWWISIRRPQQMGALLHEVMHIVMMNLIRRKNRKPQVWNIACDIVNNGLILTEFQGKQHLVKLPPNVVIRKDLQHLSAEEVYEILIKESKEKTKVLPKEEEEDKDEDKDEDENEDEDEDGDDDGKDGGGGIKGKGKGQFKGKSKGDGKENDKSEKENDKSEEEKIDGVDPSKKKHNDDFWDYNPGCFHEHDGPIDDPKFEGDIKNILRRAANQARSESHGKLKQGTEEFIQRYLGEPLVDWRYVLMEFVTASYDDFQGPFDRRLIHQGYYFETLETENVNIYFAIDTSGSISSEEIAVFLGELRAIMRLYPSLEAQGFWADADIYGPNSIESMMNSGKALGGGGTSFVPFFEWIKKNAGPVGVHVAIYFTDGFGDFPNDPPNIPVLWVVLPGGLDSKKFPFGRVVRMLRSAER